MPRAAEPRSHCPISFSLDLIGDRWTLLVLRDLVIAGKRRFGELLVSPERIATNVLSERLRRLERAGMVTRRPDPTSARQVIYEPTEKGLDLLPIMIEMVRWGAHYDPDTEAPPAFVRRLDRDREGVIAEFRARHAPPGDAVRRRRPSGG